jgi:hypothetical protein
MGANHTHGFHTSFPLVCTKTVKQTKFLWKFGHIRLNPISITSLNKSQT